MGESPERSKLCALLCLFRVSNDVLPYRTAPIPQIMQRRLRTVRCRTLLTGLSCTLLLLLSATNSALGAGAASAEGTYHPALQSQKRQVLGTAGQGDSRTTVFDPRDGFATEQLKKREVGGLSRELLLATTEFMVEILPICNIMHLITSVFALAAHAQLFNQKSRALALARRGEMRCALRMVCS